MEFIKDQEKRILLSAISREKKVIKEHKELAELIPVINQLDYYFMYDRLFKQIYNQALEDAKNRYREWSKSEYGKVVADDVLPIRVLRSLRK